MPDRLNANMRFDTETIRNFLSHAARFVLRNTRDADEGAVTDMVSRKVKCMVGRNEDPPTEVELAVRSVQAWQTAEEAATMVQEEREWHGAADESANPNNFKIHVAADGGKSVFPSKVQSIRPKEERATIEEIFDAPVIRAPVKWLVRVSFPSTDAIALCDSDGDINAITENVRELSHGLCVRRDEDMFEFIGPPTDDVSFALGCRDRFVRLRMCSDYLIIEERIRFDRNGVSEIVLNFEQLQAEPEWEITFLGVEFAATRVRFGESGARLEQSGQEMVLKDLGRVVN